MNTRSKMPRLTKTQMAQVVVTALYNMPALASADHHEVVLRASRGTVESLTRQHKMAMDAIQSRQATT